MKLLIIMMMMFTTVNSFGQTLKQIALKKMDLNNAETVKTGLINHGLNCSPSLKNDDGLNTGLDANVTSVYNAKGQYYTAEFACRDYADMVGAEMAYDETALNNDWATTLPYTQPVAVKDTAVYDALAAEAWAPATAPSTTVNTLQTATAK
jgi:hypothetical protein